MADARAVDLPAAVLNDVAGVVHTEVTILDRVSGGISAGAVRVQLGAHA